MKKRQEKVHVLAAFGDIKGSGAYRQRITDEKKQSIPFWSKFDDLIDDFENDHDYFMNHLGDGFFCVTKVQGHNGSLAIKFLSEMIELKKKIDRLIEGTKYPRPDGFRVHVSSGHALQKILSNGKLVFHGYHLDLIGTTIKLEALKSIPFVVHESAKELLSPTEIERAGFQFDLLAMPRIRRASEGIYKEDLKALYALSR